MSTFSINSTKKLNTEKEEVDGSLGFGNYVLQSRKNAIFNMHDLKTY